MKHNFKKRVLRVIAELKQFAGGSNALIISSNPSATRSADQNHPYRANSDLYYLTGCTAPEVTLIVKDSGPDPITLIVEPEDPKKIIWEGRRQEIAPIAKEIGARVIRSQDPKKTIKEMLRDVRCIFTQTIPGTISNSIRLDFARQSGETPKRSPIACANADTILSPLRLIKSSSEIQAIAEAGAVTSEVLHSIVPMLVPGTKEREIATLIESIYRTSGGEPAFGAIVASGASAATLHYHSHTKTLKRGDLLLIDTGIELGMYASDITRTIPIGPISAAQTTLYEAVLAAQKAAFSAIKHNALIRDIYLAAAKEITIGLKETGVLHGSLTSLLKKEAYKPYFPHGIGHTLGIDVHDVGGLRGDNESRLKTGMVFTIEPGVYLAKPTKHLPALGIRIEDDIVVERNGCSILTENAFPKELEDIAAVMGV
jgi:Xaa-Pro aminopeptidase